MPKISIIVPVYNVVKYIGRCIESVQGQSLADWEMIMVDDVGKDGSMDIVKDYASKDVRIKYIESERNEGPMVARNKGCRQAIGEYIMFLDGDDTLPNDALEVLYNSISANHTDCVKGNIMIKSNDGKEKLFHENALPYGTKVEEVVKALLEDKIAHNITGCLFCRELLLNDEVKIVQGMKNSEDAYLFYQLVERMTNGMVIIPNVVYYYHVNESSSTHGPITKETLKKMLVIQKYKASLINKYPQLKKNVRHAVVRQIAFMSLRYGRKEVNSFVHEYNMDEYISLVYVLKYLNGRDYFDILKFLICG